MRDVLKQISRSLVEILTPEGHAAARLGSGFVISPRGLIVTCAHVIAQPPRVQFLGETRAYPTKLVGRDLDHDLVLFSADRDTQPLPLGEIGQVEAGDEVVWGGFPLESWIPSFHKGMISFKGEIPLPESNIQSQALQLDGTSNKGNSGGPIVDPRDGRVVGIVSAGLGRLDEELRAVAGRGQEAFRIEITGVDPVSNIKAIIDSMERHLQLGIAYGISVQYLSALVRSSGA